MELNTNVTGAGMLALASSVLTALAAFLPWVTAKVQAGPVDVSASTAGIEGLGILPFLLAVSAAPGGWSYRSSTAGSTPGGAR